ncbi:MAG: hypothetical protein KBB83_05955 [Alphaproteobacteria bacterium]|nr:hypothetical protein [Alphaproteobacteria bacterium]
MTFKFIAHLLIVLCLNAAAYASSDVGGTYDDTPPLTDEDNPSEDENPHPAIISENARRYYNRVCNQGYPNHLRNALDENRDNE